MRVRFTGASRRDLADIALFIPRDSERRALSLVDELEQACLALADHPDRFSHLEGWEDKNLRRRPYGRYLIVYRVTEDLVMIHRIISAALDSTYLFFDIPEGKEGD
jgi:toxin ParE1/3/4